MVFHRLGIIALGMAALALAACAGSPMKGYTGPVLPAEQTALVKTGPYAELVACDGVKVSALRVAVLPGERTIEMKPSDQQLDYKRTGFVFRSKVTGSVSFTAEAGHTYVAGVSIVAAPLTDEDIGTGYTWIGTIEDETTHKRVKRTDRLPLDVLPILFGSPT
jgi:hypothetical protein